MQQVDNYGLKNASWKFKLSATAWVLFSLGLIAWSWFISLTVVSWYSTGISKHTMLGAELLNLAWTKFRIFLFLFVLQTIATLRLWFVGKNLLKKSSLRRRARTVLQWIGFLVMILNMFVWLT